MGIRGLNSLVKKYSEESVNEINIKDIKNSIVAIDCSILLYKFRYASRAPNSHLVGLVNRIKFYLMNDILPVFVFDGSPPEAKKHTIAKRHAAKEKLYIKLEQLRDEVPKDEEHSKKIQEEIEKINSQIIVIKKVHIDECKELLEKIGIPYICAPDDAEKYCCFLQKNGLVNYTVTDDTDAITFGCEKIIKTSINKNITIIDTNSILQNFQMTHEMFVDFCILAGCDYADTISQVGPVSAFNLIKKHKCIEEVLKNLDKPTDNFQYLEARKIFRTFDYTIPEPFKIKKINKQVLLDFLTNHNFNENVISKIIKILI
jgi:flap endonuclease-1